MKRLGMVAFVALVACSAFGQGMPAGTHEFRVDVGSDIQANDNTEPYVFGGVGFFFADDLDLGLYISWRKTRWESYWGPDSAWGLGVFGEYDFPIDSPLVPFICARAGMLDGGEENDNALNIAGGGGLRLFVTEILSITLTAEIDWASEDVFNFERDPDGKGSGDNVDGTVRLGARLFF
jgi:hypothetical protein